MVKESKVIDNIKKYFKKKYPECCITKVHVSPIHNRGFPDLLILTLKGVYFIEVKAPGKRPTRLQETRLNEFKKASDPSKVFCYWATCEKKNPKELIFYDPKSNKEVWRDVLVY